jgi:lysophospholipase L1-like esterase
VIPQAASMRDAGGRAPRVLELGARVLGLVEFFFRRSDKSGDISPTDAPLGEVEGADALGVLVLGEANAVGLGVTRHTLGMAGHLARHLNARTGRGVRWSAARVETDLLRNLPAAVREHRGALAHADVVVLMIGIVDTLSLTRTRAWSAQMASALDLLTASLPVTATILVTSIPPMDNAGSISRLARLAAGRQARALNRESASLIGERDNCHIVAFPTTLSQELWAPQARETPYLKMYDEWARSAADTVHAVEEERAAFFDR